MTDRSPSSTYRLQITPGFTLVDAVEVLDHVHRLGAGAVYCSPLLKSADGSDHGYDVVDVTRVDDARGGEEGWRALLSAARECGLGVVLDIVPNHLGVADAAQNPAWWDVLRHGQSSAYAAWFDVEWAHGRILLPVLGPEADLGTELSIVDGELRYAAHRFPIAPGTDPLPGDTAADVHARQHYELVDARRADTDQNYRRFFAVTTLAGVRVEDPAVAAATHRRILAWLKEDQVDGVRVDHPDGLAGPATYLTWLRSVAPDTWLTVEKILEPGEDMPPRWQVDGTTGYDALAEVGPLFVDPRAEPVLDRLYRDVSGDHLDFAGHVEAGKRLVATTILRAEFHRLARLIPDQPHAVEALTELAVAFPVYRSYLPDGAEHLEEAVNVACGRRPALADAIATLIPRLTDPADELSARFQQTTGAVMAKGVEDTAYYRYNRFIALNEVGGDPSRFGLHLDAFHGAQQRRLMNAPRSMTTLSTHDTKRGEDVRARLAVLAELPDEWSALVLLLRERAPMPNAALGYLLWQTVVGVGLDNGPRLHAYAEKAMREAADGTSWADPDKEFERAVHAALDALHDRPELRSLINGFIDRIRPFGWSNALGQKLVQLTMPGVPDVYRGTEGWEDSLVDPDNRRPVDFAALRRLLAADQPSVDGSGAAKAWVVSRALRLRRDRPELFSGYLRVPVTGPAAEHAVAFDRGGAITVATRLPARLRARGGWGDTAADLPGGMVDILTGRTVGGPTPLSQLLGRYPVALLAPG
jgi:(1->4)-alpha-D-glucan 1-alpha-D-glucosylmutase